MRTLWLTCVLAGCSYDPGSGGPAPDDTAAPTDAPCATFSSFVDTCGLTAGGPLTLSGSLTFDTNSGDLFAGATPIEVTTQTIATSSGEVKAIIAASVVLAPDTRLRAEGSRGFAILSLDAIQLDSNARIDVSSGGAGARTTCPSMPGVGGNRDGGAGGGGGGGFGGPGGSGGKGDSSNSTGGAGGAAVALPEGIIGGCPGAAGGDDNNDPGGRGGVAGGAVYLAAARRIDLASGSGIDAAGEGGRGGAQHMLFNGDAGGGGGGSGGMIVLEAKTVASSGTLAANGGGGGEASGNVQGGRAGDPGTFGTTSAKGGADGSSTGTDGGNGGAKQDRSGASVLDAQAGGGGGGGGGAGFVRILTSAPDLNAQVSPDPS